MSKLKVTRVYLKDQSGKLYRICSIANPKDSKGEYYLKIMFPDIKGIPLLTGQHGKDGIVGKTSRLEGGVQEFSYHYRSGISHFKDSNGHIDQETDKPTLFNFPALHLVRFIVRSLASFDVQDPLKITKSDFILPTPFDNRARGFEFVLSRVLGWHVTNTQGLDPVQCYKVALVDPNLTFHIADSVWTRPPIEKGHALFEIFRYADPTSNFSVVGKFE